MTSHYKAIKLSEQYVIPMTIIQQYHKEGNKNIILKNADSPQEEINKASSVDYYAFCVGSIRGASDDISWLQQFKDNE
jgi:hypothetical protein